MSEQDVTKLRCEVHHPAWPERSTDRPGGQGTRALRAGALLLAVLGHDCGRRWPASTHDGGSPEAPVTAEAASARYVGVPQLELYSGARSIAHPTRPLLGQIVDGACRVWDLGQSLYRGTVPGAECAGWAPQVSPLPPEIARGTPISPPGKEIVASASADGRFWAVGGADDAEVRVWDARARSPLRTLSLCPARERNCFLRLSGLVWTPEGKLFALDRAGVPTMLDPEGVADPATVRSVVSIQGGRFDDSGRYLVFSGSRPSGVPGEDENVNGVLSLRDGTVIAAPSVWARGDEPEWSVFWKRDGRAFFGASGRGWNFQSCEPTSLVVREIDVTAAAINETSVGAGEATFGEPSPDGRMLLFTTRELGPCTVAPPTEENRGVIARVHLWAPSAEPGLRWTIDGKLAAAVWSPSSNAVALAVGASIRIAGLDHAAGDPSFLGSWPGRPPITWSTDGARIVSREGQVLAVREARTWARVAQIPFAAVALAWGPTGILAVADAAGLALWHSEPLAPTDRVALPGIDALSWSPSGSALCARTARGMFVIKPGKGGPPRALGDRSLARASCSWVSDGEIVTRSPYAVHRFSAHGGVWSDGVVPVKRVEHMDPWGRFEAGPRALVRVADGEVLHYHAGALWTESYHYAPSPPGTWIFRDGPDVLGGNMIHAKDATFLRPTPDLGALFLSGDALPRRYSEAAR